MCSTVLDNVGLCRSELFRLELRMPFVVKREAYIFYNYIIKGATDSLNIISGESSIWERTVQ